MAFPTNVGTSRSDPQSTFENDHFQNEQSCQDIDRSLTNSVPRNVTDEQQTTIINLVDTTVQQSIEKIVSDNTKQTQIEDSNKKQSAEAAPKADVENSKADNDVVYNAEWDGRTTLQETVIATIDTVNGVRNTMSIVGTSAAFPSLTAMSKATLVIGGTTSAASFMFLLTGVMAIIVCIASLIPLGFEELKNSSEELKAAIESKIQERINDAAEALQEAKLCLANFIGALFMGISQIFEGAVGICTTPLLTKAFHIHAFSSASLKAGFVAGSGCALGGIYVFRGSIQAYRAVKNLNRVNQFYEQFKNKLDPDNANLDDPMEFLNAKREIGDAYWGRRVDTSCLKEKAATLSSTNEEKIKHLQEVDKGIYSLQLKNRISLFIATAMIVGGIISIVLSFVTAGIVPLIFTLICFIAFTSMEFIFLSSDVTSLYQWLLDRMYVQSQELTAFLAALKKKENVELLAIEKADDLGYAQD